MSQAKQIAVNTPDVREERIAELRRRIAEKSYNVEPEAVAEKMIEAHSA